MSMLPITGCLTAAVLMVLSGMHAAHAQEVFASGDRDAGDPFSTGPCRDPQIAERERREGAHAYLDTTGKVRAAANYLARKYDDPFVNSGAVCAQGPGVVFLIPDRFDGEFHEVVRLIDEFGATPAGPQAVADVPRTPDRYNSISSTGCPYPADIDPNRMSPLAPPDARINDAEAAFQQRVNLCQQQRGHLVPGGCASVCMGENRLTVALAQRRPKLRTERQPGEPRQLDIDPREPLSAATTCTMPALGQLAEAPDQGAIAIPHVPTSEAGGPAAARPVAIEEGDMAVALALPASTRLTGGISRQAVFVAPRPSEPSKSTAAGRREVPPQHVTLQGYVRDSLRIPASYVPRKPRTKRATPAVERRVTMMLTGGVGTYSPEVGRARFIAGLLNGTKTRLAEYTRFGRNDPAAAGNTRPDSTSQDGQSCELKVQSPKVFGEFNPGKNPGEAAKTIWDMIAAIIENKKHLDPVVLKEFQDLKANTLVGPIFGSASFISSYADSLRSIIDRDTRLKEAMLNSPGRDLDPRDVGYLAGEDMADAYSFFVKGSFAFFP